MAIRLTGLSQIAIGSWDFYKAKKALQEGNLSEEESLSRKRLNQAKVGLGALKLVLIGYTSSSIISPLLNNESFSNTDIALLATFAAGYAVLSFQDVYSPFLNDEAINYKYNQSKLEEKFKIKLNDNEGFQLQGGDAYRLYMLGNKLSTGNPVDSLMFNVREKINTWKLKLNLDKDKEIGIIRKSIYKILKFNGISSILDSVYSKAKIKEESIKTIKEFSDFKSLSNKEFMEYIKKENKEISSNEEDIKSKLKEINQEAIIKSHKKILVQNLQLFFSQVVMDYNNGNIDKKLLEKFEKLNEQNTIKSKNIVLFEEYSKISKISRMMLNKEDLKDKFKTNSDVFKYLGSQFLTKEGNVKFLNFDSIFKLERKSIINNKNGLNKINTNIYEDKKANFAELSFENNLITQFSIIKENKKTISNKLNNS